MIGEKRLKIEGDEADESLENRLEEHIEETKKANSDLKT